MRDLIIRYRKHIALGLAALALCAASFSFGRFSQDEKVVYQDKIVYQDRVVEKIVEVEKVVEATEDKVEKKRVVKRSVVEKTSPDGSVEKRVDETLDEGESSSKIEVKYVDRVVYVEKEKETSLDQEQSISTSKTLPDWRLGLLMGASPVDIATSRELAMDDLVLGVEAQRRLIGPVYGGLWGFNNGTVGVSLGLEF